MSVTRSEFGRIGDTTITAVDIDGGSGVRLKLLSYGARLAELHVPDRQGRAADVVLAFDRIDDYSANGSFFGATCGRYGNRIRRGAFALDGKAIRVTCNEPPNHLHGGFQGFDRKPWDLAVDATCNEVTFSLVSLDGDEGFPGEAMVSTSYRLDGDTLEVIMRGTTDQPTVLNMVNHAYWNLGGHAAGDIRGHELTLNANYYTPVDAELLTTGEILAVAGTPFDFRVPKPIGRDIDAVRYEDALHAAGGARSGYDHNWCLAGESGRMKLCARVVDNASGRGMELHTTEPGVQFYTAGHLSDRIVGKAGVRYGKYAGFTLETQKYPNSPNCGHFPSPRLDPGQDYEHRMLYRFFAN